MGKALCCNLLGNTEASSKPCHPPSLLRSRLEATEGNSQDPFDLAKVRKSSVCLSPSFPGLLVPLATPCPVDESLPPLPTPLPSVFLMMAGDELLCWPTRNKAHSMLAFFLMHPQDAILLVSFPHPAFPLSETPQFPPLWPHVDPSFPELDQEKQGYRRIQGLTGMWVGCVCGGRVLEVKGKLNSSL